MTRFEKGLYSIAAIILVFLYLLSSTNFFSTESTPEISTISIISKEKDDLYRRTMRKGMEKAAIDAWVDLNFITLYDNYNLEQQEEMIRQEISNAVDAIIVMPIEGLHLEEILEETGSTIPIIILGESGDFSRAVSQIHPDTSLLGRDLATLVLSQRFLDEKIYLLNEDQGEEMNQMITIATQVFDEQGKPYEIFTGSGQELGEVLLKNTESCSVLIFNERTLVETAKANKSASTVFYGIGASSTSVFSLEDGTISGIVAPDMYMMGYYGMEQAINSVNRVGNEKDILINHRAVTQNTIFDKENEVFLFPLN